MIPIGLFLSLLFPVFKYNAMNFAEKIFVVGSTVAAVGKRGKGKTHWIVLCMEMTIKCDFEVITNILFEKCIGFDKGKPIYKEYYPPHIHKVTSFAQLMKTIAEILKKDRNKKIALFWDECQNFMHSYRAMGKIEFSVLQFHGIARKFNLVMVEISPSMAGILGEVQRNYMDFVFDKSLGALMRYNKNHKVQYKSRDVVFLKTTDQYFNGEDGIPIKVPIGAFAKPVELHELGGIYYDHLASGDFIMGKKDNGEDFELKEFVHCISNVISQDVPDQILKYLAGEPLVDIIEQEEPTACRMCGKPLDSGKEDEFTEDGFCDALCSTVYKDKKKLTKR